MNGGVYVGLRPPFQETVTVEVNVNSQVDTLRVYLVKPDNTYKVLDNRGSTQPGKYMYEITPNMPGIWRVGAEITKRDIGLYLQRCNLICGS